MGMYDDIKYAMDCPKCGAHVSSFQSKDGPCTLSTLHFWDVNHFYSNCPKCHAWIEFNLAVPRPRLPIEAYTMTCRERVSKEYDGKDIHS